MNLNLTPSLKSGGTEPAPRSVPLAKRGDEFRTPSLRFPLQAGGTKTLRFPSHSGGNLTEGGKQVQTPSCRFPLPAGGTETVLRVVPLMLYQSRSQSSQKRVCPITPSLRFPLQAGGNQDPSVPLAQRGEPYGGGNCKLCPCDWY